jgi:hypothetical protein
VVYAFLYPYWFFLCLKARSFFFFNAANPSIKNGGFLMESKKEIYDLIPTSFYPRTLFFKKGTSPDHIWNQVEEAALGFPLIAKPDIGMRGLNVKKIYNWNELHTYSLQSQVDFLVQEYISYEKEAGLFYYRLPGWSSGTLSGIVYKEMVTVTGDGKLSLLQLIQKEKRYILQLEVLKEMFKNDLHKIIADGEEVILVPYGNHSRGAKFIDASERISEKLIQSIDKICQQIPEFYYGRLDIRFSSWDELSEGKKFSIIELNGAGSEPTHMYDPKHSLFSAWRIIIQHWNILYKISTLNKKSTPYLSFKKGIQMFRENANYLKLLDIKES